MVRVNLLPPKILLDQHLLAEWNEIQMLFGYIQKYPELDGSEPKEYKLSKGHIKFFKDKTLYLYKRLIELKKEAIERGYLFKDVDEIFSSYNLPKEFYNDYVPTLEAYKIIIARLLAKHAMKLDWYTLRGWCITKELYEDILTNEYKALEALKGEKNGLD